MSPVSLEGQGVVVLYSKSHCIFRRTGRMNPVTPSITVSLENKTYESYISKHYIFRRTGRMCPVSPRITEEE